MPPKLLGSLKNLLQKSGKKKTGKHGNNDTTTTTTVATTTATTIFTTTTGTRSPMSTRQNHPQPRTDHDMDSERTRAPLINLAHCSLTSSSLPAPCSATPQHRPSPQSPQPGGELSNATYNTNPAAADPSAKPAPHGCPARFPVEGLPDLMRSLDLVDPGGLHSTGSYLSEDSGVQEEQPPTVIRRRPPSAHPAEETTQPPSEIAGGNPAQPSLHASSSGFFSSASQAGGQKDPASSHDSQGLPKDLVASGGKASASAPIRVRQEPPPPPHAAPKPSHSLPVCRREIEEAASAAAASSAAAAAAAAAQSGGSLIRLGMGEELGGMETGEMFPDTALETPIGALRKSRKRLCLMLNIEQPLIDTDFPPDYTGLAEMLGFESLEIQNFWERNPADTLFMEWCRCHSGSRLLRPVLRTLLDCLESLGRQDVVMECRGLIWEDVSDYLAEQRLLDEYTVSRLQKFDCYVNIAEQDLLGVGREILQNLEGVHGLRLCLTLRDVTLGGFEFEEMAKMLETRCDSKVLIVLSKSYEDSDACQFLTQFAVTLDPGSRRNKLIPLLVDEDTCIPRVLRCLAMLNYGRDKRYGFLWPRLKNAIKS